MLKKYWWFIIGLVILLIVFSYLYAMRAEKFYLGADICKNSLQINYSPAIEAIEPDVTDERFFRPSKKSAYILTKTDIGENNIPLFKTPEDLIKSYYKLLSDASNMEGYCAGCGSIGSGTEPYKTAYKLFSDKARDKMPYIKYLDSFKGVGHTTLLELQPAYSPPGTPPDTLYFFVEIEVITGEKCVNDTLQATNFEYYTGIITAKKTSGGWKIENITYVPEDFLCAPYHSWFWDAKAVTEIVYKDNLKLFDNYTVSKKDNIITVEGRAGKDRYKLEFIRITNGHDKLLFEYKLVNGKWQITDIPKKDFENLKFYVNNL